VTARTEGALRVDRVLADPLAVPRGLDAVLRRMERGAREQRDLLAPLAARPDAAEPVRAAAAELERFLEDEERSPLLRALRRPLRQIAPDTPGGRSLQRAWDGLRGRAEAAVELQAALDGIHAAAARVRERFAAALPRATRAILAEERLDEAQLARTGRAQDVPPLHRRLRRAEHALGRLLRAMEEDVDGARVEPGTSWAEEAAPGEVLALLRLRLRERERLRHEGGPAPTLRLLAARQVRALGAAGRWKRPASTGAHAVAQRMGELLLRGDAHARGGEDLALWDGLLGAASDALHDAARPGAWAAQLSDAPLPAARDIGSTRFVVPIDATYALISAAHPSSVCVTSRRVALDRGVECAVFLEEGERETLPLAELDVDPLFEGLAAEPAWYATARKAQLQVIARVGEGWIARLVRRGALRRTRDGAWNAEPRDDGRLRVLGTLSAPPTADAWEVGPAPGAERVFCGVRTVPVAPPLAECEAGWLRVPGPGAWGGEAVRAEEACFRAVARQVPLTVPARAGRGRLGARGLEGPLYVPPLGLRAAELPPLDAWLRSGAAHPLLSAVARLWLRLTGAGWALGAYHLDALVFSMGWSDAKGTPAAHAVVTDAPFAARLGTHHARPPADEAHVPLYARLGCRVLPPAVAAGEVALPETEVRAFALFALDELATKPLPLSGLVSSEVLTVAVPDCADRFIYPQTAVRLAQSLAPGARTAGVEGWIQRLAAGER
jgi:hypothetical protein